jgi:hypothetical protein
MLPRNVRHAISRIARLVSKTKLIMTLHAQFVLMDTNLKTMDIRNVRRMESL